MLTTHDLFLFICDYFATTGECYGDTCKYCIYKIRCSMIAYSAYHVLETGCYE